MATTMLRKATAPKRILVVEDDPLVAHMIRMALAVDGHTVEIASDGEKGLAMVTTGDYDLVITDFQLGAMDGLELAELIKRHSPGKPIVLITAYSEKISGNMGEVSNVDLLLRKPFSVADLHAALAKFFPAT